MVKTSVCQKAVETPLLLLLGGESYYCMELLYRGRSHWSMMLCGALSFLAIYRLNERHPQKPLLLRALAGASIITGLEFVTGCVVNLWMDWKIWDYSKLPYHVLGQICLPFSILWFLLCIPVCGVCKLIRETVFGTHARKI